MIFQNWFAKEISVRLTEEGKGFISTVSYSIRLPKSGSIRFKKTAQFLTLARFDSEFKAKAVLHRASLNGDQPENIQFERHIWR
jgi:hypothetical protein